MNQFLRTYTVDRYTLLTGHPLASLAGFHINRFLHVTAGARIYVQLAVYTRKDGGTCVQYAGSELDGSTAYEGLRG
jgi:hypothetical protein